MKVSTLTLCHQGLSLISASYTVLFVSLLAHAAQFAFLTIVENPRKIFFPCEGGSANGNIPRY